MRSDKDDDGVFILGVYIHIVVLLTRSEVRGAQYWMRKYCMRWTLFHLDRRRTGLARGIELPL